MTARTARWAWAATLWAVGCVPGGEQTFQSSGAPTRRLEIRSASTVPREGWSEFDDPFGNEPLFVSPTVELTNADVVRSTVRQGADGDWQVWLTLTTAGTETFAALTATLVPDAQATGPSTQRLAVLVDGVVLIAPVVRERISNGTCVLSGRFTRDEARDLARGLVGS